MSRQRLKIGFYTHGSRKIGMGHVFRCLALAKAFRGRWPGCQISFALKERSRGVEIIERAHASAATVCPRGRLPRGNWDVLVVDQLRVSPARMRRLKRRARVLISIDDAGPGHFEADASFNMLYRCRARRPKGSQTRSRFGFENMILDPSFAARAYRVRKAVKNVLLIQGGADPHGVLSRAVNAMSGWLRANPDVTLHMHVGPAARTPARLSALRELTRGYRMRLHTEVRSMAALYGRMDLAVSAVGVTPFELAAVGVPLILLTGEKKELETARALAARRCAVNLGAVSSRALKRLPAELDRLSADLAARKRLSAAERRAVDGRGAERITRAIASLLG